MYRHTLIILLLIHIMFFSSFAFANRAPALIEGNFKMISAGLAHTCALSNKGISCWGDNIDGQAPSFIEGDFEMISAGFNNTCAINNGSNGGRISCWGGSTDNKIPTGGNFKVVSTGPLHSCALNHKGLSCWGDNRFGQAPILYQG